MRYSEEDLETLDIDWFALDEKAHVAHFTSAGVCFIPNSIMSSVENNEAVFNAIDKLPKVCDAEILDVNLPEFDQLSSRSMYIKNFKEMACKGIYSYDASGNDAYVLIAKPTKSVNLSQISLDVADIVKETSLEGVLFESSNKIYSEMF